jgi:hypothetical protein
LERFSPNPSRRRVSPLRITSRGGTTKARTPDLPRWSALASPDSPSRGVTVCYQVQPDTVNLSGSSATSFPSWARVTLRAKHREGAGRVLSVPCVYTTCWAGSVVLSTATASSIALESMCAPRPRGDLHRSISSWSFPSARLHDDVTALHRLSVAAVQPEGLHLTLRHGSAPQTHSDYSHYYPRRADGRVGVPLRCISPSCCPRYVPLDQSATIGNLCTYPSRMRPLETPLAHRTPSNATSGRGNPARCRARCLSTSHPFRLIWHLPPSRSASNIRTSGVPFQTLTVV